MDSQICEAKHTAIDEKIVNQDKLWQERFEAQNKIFDEKFTGLKMHWKDEYSRTTKNIDDIVGKVDINTKRLINIENIVEDFKEFIYNFNKKKDEQKEVIKSKRNNLIYPIVVAVISGLFFWIVNHWIK